MYSQCQIAECIANALHRSIVESLIKPAKSARIIATQSSLNWLSDLFLVQLTSLVQLQTPLHCAETGIHMIRDTIPLPLDSGRTAKSRPKQVDEFDI